jgi:hypothetical protein
VWISRSLLRPGSADCGQARPSFLKKRSKKLLDVCTFASRPAQPNGQKFFGSFFQKRTCFLSPYSGSETMSTRTYQKYLSYLSSEGMLALYGSVTPILYHDLGHEPE